MIKQIFFDVDGTLVSKDDEIRPGAFEVMKFCKDKGIVVTMWSGGGIDYAKTWARRIDPKNELHINFFFKNPSLLEEGHMTVDDMKEVQKIADGLGAKGYWIPFFEPAIVKNDVELYKLKEVIAQLCP